MAYLHHYTHTCGPPSSGINLVEINRTTTPRGSCQGLRPGFDAGPTTPLTGRMRCMVDTSVPSPKNRRFPASPGLGVGMAGIVPATVSE